MNNLQTNICFFINVPIKLFFPHVYFLNHSISNKLSKCLFEIYQYPQYKISIIRFIMNCIFIFIFIISYVDSLFHKLDQNRHVWLLENLICIMFVEQTEYPLWSKKKAKGRNIFLKRKHWVPWLCLCVCARALSTLSKEIDNIFFVNSPTSNARVNVVLRINRYNV